MRDDDCVSDEDQTIKAALRKYEDFKATCGDLLDPSENTLVAVAAAWLSRNVG